MPVIGILYAHINPLAHLLWIAVVVYHIYWCFTMCKAKERPIDTHPVLDGIV